MLKSTANVFGSFYTRQTECFACLSYGLGVCQSISL